jgi:hypothetical protein
MGNCVFSDNPENEKENEKLQKEILKELAERKVIILLFNFILQLLTEIDYHSFKK